MVRIDERKVEAKPNHDQFIAAFRSSAIRKRTQRFTDQRGCKWHVLGRFILFACDFEIIRKLGFEKLDKPTEEDQAVLLQEAIEKGQEESKLGKVLLDVLYIYNLDSGIPDDYELIDCKDISKVSLVSNKSIIATSKSKFCIKLELKDKVHFFATDYGSVAHNWLRILKKSKSEQEEALRSEKLQIVKNIDWVVWLFESNQGLEVMKYSTSEFERTSKDAHNESSPPAAWIAAMRASQQNYFEILDALQAHRPFYQELFRTVIETYHVKWTERLKSCYNNHIKILSVTLLLLTPQG